ncbi:Putative type II secretion system protein D [bacterium HR17]|jgi:pilus assembly protein CpaC|uniref:Type II secretion system protein D n=1 Tax=Candidatus Fervidibacter japonicus TaxID=2035412 RepID=A0A2H5X9J4_9BACT|nr:Putative type II secretion system protein D [bacterium HR17]
MGKWRWLLFTLSFVTVALSAQPSERTVNVSENPIVAVQPAMPTRLLMHRGVSAVLTTQGTVRRFVLGDPQVAAVTPLSPRELVVNAKSEGSTNLIVWEDRNGQTVTAAFWVEVAPTKREETPAPPQSVAPSPQQVQAVLQRALVGLPVEPVVLALPDGTVCVVLRGEVDAPETAKAVEAMAQLVAPKVVNMLRVRQPVRPDLAPDELKARRIEHAIGVPGVRVAVADDKVILHGTVSSLMDYAVAEERAKPFGTVINRLEVATPKIRQFVTDVKVLEVQRSALQKLGITWGTVTAAAGQQTPTFAVMPGQAVFGEPGTADRPFARASPVGAQLDALVQNGLARLLANPQQRTIEGADATFLVGGLVPIPIFGFFGVTAGATSPGAASVIFFPFGITLTLHPEATWQGEIFLQMRVEVTAPDFGLAAQVLGTTVPGFRFRGLDDVRLLLRDGDTLVISGLIQDELRQQVNRVPVLSRIPILGELFKSREFVRQQTELVLLVTVRAEEVAVSPDALHLLRIYQKRPVLPRPSFVAPFSGGSGMGGAGFGASALPAPSPANPP